MKSKVDFLKELITFETTFESGIETVSTPFVPEKTGTKTLHDTIVDYFTEDGVKYVDGKVIYWLCPKCEGSGMVY